jgi:hypothetical protein
MTILPNYHQFDGLHWETGSVRNALDYQGILAPHTGQPLSEALLLGISGGIVFGYFIFDYEGYDPHVALLSRNTFEPLDTLLERLRIPQDNYQTSNPRTAEENLIDVLENGRPAIVFADHYSLSYNAMPNHEQMWGYMPLIVFGLEGGCAQIADRARVPLEVTTAELAQARGRVKKHKHRLLALDPPNLERLPAAVTQGIWQTISLFCEAPPRGSRDNFGLAAYEKWAEMLENTRNKKSWARFLPPGPRMYAALAGYPGQPSAFSWAASTWGTGHTVDRQMYSDFLEEAAVILNKPALAELSADFRMSSAAWGRLAEALLPAAIVPDEYPLLAETRKLQLRKHEVFIETGQAGLDEINSINARLTELRRQAETEFALDDTRAARFRENLREHLVEVKEIEQQAIKNLQEIMA